MRYPSFLKAICCLAVATGSAGAERPNIVIFLADDLGYADIGANGCKDVPTPHIDAIASGGVRFTDGYATHPYCSPSRAGLMSGMYQHRFGFETNSGPERYASPKFGVPRSIPTLAEKLKDAGYATGMMGKWHIGFREGLRPHERGFDHFYGFLSGARSYYPERTRDSPLLRNGRIVNDESEYLTDAFAREAVEFIDRSGDQPWFLYFAFNAVHTPMEATQKYEARFPKIKDPNRKTLAGMLSAMDDAIGRVMAKVRERGEEDETLVLFYSDNGGIPPLKDSRMGPLNYSRNDPLRGAKASVYEGGIRIPFAAQWKGNIPAGTVFKHPVMGFDCHATALAAAGISLESKPAIDGVDLLPFIKGEKEGRPHQSLFWRDSRQHAVRSGDWKLVVAPREKAQLFHLAEDIGEERDRSGENSQKLEELLAIYDDWDSQMMKPQWIRQDQRNAEPGGKLKANATPRRGGGPALAQVESAFKRNDKNNDGKLTRDEFPQSRVFDQVDADGDGFATIEEARVFYSKRRNPAGSN